MQWTLAQGAGLDAIATATFQQDFKSQIDTQGANNMSTPTIPADLRQDIYYCGLNDELRGTYDAIRYAKHELSHNDFEELYKRGSRQYQIAIGLTIEAINKQGGK
jgi:hypothetical protein